MRTVAMLYKSRECSGDSNIPTYYMHDARIAGNEAL